MFSKRREPEKKAKTTQISRVVTSESSTTTTSTATSPLASTSSSPAPARPRPQIKVATVTRMVQIVKKVSTPIPAFNRPRPPLPTVKPSSPAAGGGGKRKPESERPAAIKSRKLEVSRGSTKGSRGSSRAASVESESGSEEDRPATPRKRDATPLVERSVAAELDGRVKCISGEDMVLRNRMAYTHYFNDPLDPARPPIDWAGTDEPSITLELPGIGASEKILLMSPLKGGEEYDPIEDILESIRLVLDFFLTPEQAQTLFAYTASNTSLFAFLSEPSSRSSTPTIGTDIPLMRQLEKAKAKKDGPGFIAAVERFNAGLRGLKEEGKIAENIRAMKGVQTKLWMKITAQVYERAVGPEIEELRRYEAFSDNVYGELLPRFMSEIMEQTGLGPNSVFVDLGSGVGNCVVQAALATGCEAYGFENMAHASSLARLQVQEAEARFRMWGLKGGAMKTVEADFCQCPEVNEVLHRADVLLVNNEVFSSKLNERLSLLFLDLRSGTRIVSLKAFASSFTLSAHNQDSPLAILDQGGERHYGRKSVSWKDEGGTFFIGRVSRKKLEKFTKREEEKRRRALAAATTLED